MSSRGRGPSSSARPQRRESRVTRLTAAKSSTESSDEEKSYELVKKSTIATGSEHHRFLEELLQLNIDSEWVHGGHRSLERDMGTRKEIYATPPST